MNILIFAIGSVIFVTYMYFLIRMINRAHKQQEREQGRYNYKTKKQLGSTEEFVKKVTLPKVDQKKVIQLNEGWDS